MLATIKDIADFYDRFPQYIGKLQTDTRYGPKSIEWADITARDSKVVMIQTETGRCVESSPDHRFWVNGDWTYTKNLKIGDTVSTICGDETITELSVSKETLDLYDLQIADVHEFYANGFVSHNSSMLDALSYVLYNKPFRKINKPQLVNQINKKDLVVEVEFTVKGTYYKIRRGINPGFLEIHKNGVVLNHEAAAKDHQAYLEENILGLSFKSFCQIVIVGSSSYVPFMQLPAQSRRDVIEDILHLQIFSTMNVLVKEKLSELNNSIKSCKSDISLVEYKIESSKNHQKNIQSLIDEQKENIKNRIKTTIEEVELNEAEAKTISNEIGDLLPLIQDKPDLTSKKSELQKTYYQLGSEKKRLLKEKKFYTDNDNCPSCGQDICEHMKNEKNDAINKEIEKLEKQEKNAQNDIKNLEESISYIDENEEKISNKRLCLGEANSRVKIAKSQLQQLAKDLKNLDKSVQKDEETDIKAFVKELKELKVSYNKFLQDKEEYSVLAMLLKDGGIKSQIVRQYIPIINQLINKYLHAMDFFVQFELDENFNETIKSRHRDKFSYASFSEGEKFRLDLAMLFAWRAISKMRNSVSTNLLIMDEVMDSSLDNNGTDEFLKIIREASKDANIYIISHKGESIFDKFDNVIKFEKQKNFSVMVSD